VGWVSKYLVAKRQPAHTRLNAEHVVVDGVHVEDTCADSGEGDLGVVNAGEVAGTCGLVLLGLEGEGVGVDAGVGVAAVVPEGLHLVEVLAVLLLEAVLAVEHEAEPAIETKGASSLLRETVGVGSQEKRCTGEVGDGTSEVVTIITQLVCTGVELEVGAFCHVPQVTAGGDG